MWVGLAYEPVRRLYPLLGSYQYELVAGGYNGDDDELEDEDEEFDEDEFDEDRDEDGRTHQFVRSDDDVPAAAAAIAAEILERAQPLDQWPTTLEELLERLGGEGRTSRSLRLAAVLAAAGRYEAAQRQLDLPARDSDPDDGGWQFDRAQRRVEWQLRRWIASRGDPRLLPAGPPPGRSADSSATSAPRPSWQEVRAKSQLRRDATEAVRAQSRGKSRDELRTLLKRELADRDLRERSSTVESMLDHLNDTRADQLASGVRFLGKAAKAAGWAARALAAREFMDRVEERLPDFSPPAWTKPPQNAVYEFPPGKTWTEVVLTQDARAWLDEVLPGRPSMFGLHQLIGWCREEDTAGVRQLAVHLGEQRVGVIPEQDAAAFTDVMSDATFREELLLLQTMLLARESEPHYIFEVGLPRA